MLDKLILQMLLEAGYTKVAGPPMPDGNKPLEMGIREKRPLSQIKLPNMKVSPAAPEGTESLAKGRAEQEDIMPVFRNNPGSRLQE